MADELIGVARIDLVADGSGFQAEIAKAKSSLSSFSADAQRSYEGLNGAAKRATTNFAKWVDGLDRTAESSKLVNAAMAGVPLQVLEEGRQKILEIRAANESAAAAAREMAEAQAFEKQAAAAQRLVQASEYVNWWKDALQQAESAQARMADDQLFAQKVADAQRLVQASEYVRWWEDALQKADAAESKLASDRSFLVALENRANTAGKTTSEILEMQAAERGLTAQAAPLIARLREQESAIRKTGVEFNKYGISAKQELAALRQVPAQITDIIVSLQGGQRPLTVLLQQGGQLRDIFGGATPALKAMGGALLGMVNPATLSAGALIGLAVAYSKGAEEAQRFNATLISTGGAIGVSVSGLQTLSKNVGDATTTQHQAAEVINQFAKAGKVAALNLGDYARVAIQWSQATGESTQSIVDNFSDLAKDPLKALVKLDEQMHFLTATEYEHVRALDEVGDRTEAARHAQRLYADALADRTPKMVENLGLVESAWRNIKNATLAGVNAILSIGRAQTLFQKLTDEQGKLQAMKGMASPFGGPSKAAIANQEAVVAGIQDQIRLQGVLGRQQQGADQERIRQRALAEDRADFLKSGRTKSQQKADEVAAERLKWERVSAELKEGSDEYKKLYAAHKEILSQIDKKYEDKSRGPKNDAATRMLMSLREQEASLRAQADSSEKLTSSQSALAKFEQQIADLKNKKVLTADEKSILASQDRIRAQMQINVGLEREAEIKKALIDLEQKSAQIEQQMASSRQSTNEQYQRMLDSFGLGDKAIAQVEAQRSIYREFKKYQDELTKAAAKGGTLESDAHKKESAEIQAELQRRLAMQESYYEEVRRLQSSWILGASHGFMSYAETAENAYESVGALATKSFKGMEDALVQFVMTGKLSFKELADSIIADMIRIAVQQSITGPLAGLVGNAVSGLFGSSSLPATASWALPVMSANGNVFPSSPDLSALSGGIYNRPTAFRFAKGAGILGEAGSEAVMPLKRGPDGKLGVASQGGGGVTIIMNNNGTPQQIEGEPKVSRDQMGRAVIELMINDVRTNGKFTRALKGAMT